MIFKKDQKCWSIENYAIKEHVIEDVGFTPMSQIIKIAGFWYPADIYFHTLEKAMEADERNTFRMFK